MTDKDMLAGMVRGLEWSEVDDFLPIKAWAGRQSFCRFVIMRIVTPSGVVYRNGKNVDFASLELAKEDANDYYMSLAVPILNLDALATRANSAHVDLTDPVTVHANMLRGTIAKPTWAQILHLYPAESAALVGAAYEAAIAAVKTEKESAAKNLDPDAGSYQDGFSDAIIMIERQSWKDPLAQAALDAALKKARREGLEMALAPANEWMRLFSDVEIKHVSARVYARDTVADIRDAIRKLGDGE